MDLWWQKCPERLEYELEALKAAGIYFQEDAQARAAGIIRLFLRPVINEQQIDLIATFPNLYPYFRFEVRAPTLDLPHHQNPLAKNLCLIGRNTENWLPKDTLADFISTRVPLVLEAARSTDALTAANLEEHQGEPVTNYYPYQQNALLMIDSAWSLETDRIAGEMIVRLPDTSYPVRGAISELRGAANELLASGPSDLHRLYSKELRARWFRMSKLPALSDPRRFLEACANEHPLITVPIWKPHGALQIDLIGIVFQEELEYRKSGDGWIFIARYRPRNPPLRSKPETHFVRAGRAGHQDLQSRVPELAALTRKRIALFGLGGIGGPSAVELARSGLGELRILDRDVVEPGQIVRWPLGLPAAGLSKPQAIHQFLAHHYPFTKVVPHEHWIGAVFENMSDLKLLDEIIDGVDLIYDATAELGIQHLLSDIARERNLAYVGVSTTKGAWGGLLARIVPGKTDGCWSCLQHHLDARSIPVPIAYQDGKVQPRGCADPTFTGAGFDINQIALTGVRLAIGTLSQGVHGAYPDFDWDVGVVRMRGLNGEAIVPQWQTFPLARHSQCPCHGE
jgi:molybdopterin/thiamine biosynthesis adenylyltransferase